MQRRTINGLPATDRPGVAEYLDRSTATVEHWANNRASTGFPEPVDADRTGRGLRTRRDGDEPTGREWYALDDLDRFRTEYLVTVHAERQARVTSVRLDRADDDLITGPELAEILGVKYPTLNSWIRDSKDAWDRGEPGYLLPPHPEDCLPAKRGIARRWRPREVEAWVNARPGRGAGAGRPRNPDA